MRQIVVLEVNEIPLPLLRWYRTVRPTSVIAQLLASAAVGRTEVREALPKELYPSQTWASLSTGVPYEKHGVYWYGDPKPVEFPLYWQAAAQERTVGVLGTLHSSPLAAQCQGPGVVFAVPDVFATEPDTTPASLAPLQAFNLGMSEANARAVRSNRPTAAWGRGGVAAVRAGLRPTTGARLAGLAAGVASGRIPKERFRTAQFLLMGDVFLALAGRHRPDLAVAFTNHVAAAMHRYWFASFPQDWPEPLYDRSWVERHAGEIPAALDALDRFLGRLLPWCRSSGRTLVLVSSMGQTGGAPLESTADRQLVVDDARRFLQAVGVVGAYEVRKCMVPHFTVAFDDEASAVGAVRRLAEVDLGGPELAVDRNAAVVTCSYSLEAQGDVLLVDGRQRRLVDMGVRAQAIDDHRCGVHHPEGTLIVANSPTASLPEDPVDYLEVAPALLAALGLQPLDHHVVPTVRF